ncbi:TPA: hypothetical protein ACRVCK_002101 [Staphylococcus aureus]|uniref:hypothetical protein n=1 Tax=Staphylococcus TaxID=1279 RepID=UPI000EB90645|nr:MULTISPECIES: hypothetical protein [Staphylococcus]MBN6852331.1 hypothetical protein [Staphylococcus warneri]MDU9351523.1 hypothetical protein [Staphylococcus warneri]HBY82674.1 hypothetical protein [Staphylococcus sp.]
MDINFLIDLLNDSDVKKLTLTLITNEEIRLGKDDIKQGSSENILVLNESENLIINLNHVVKITKLYNERFSMHDVNF